MKRLAVALSAGALAIMGAPLAGAESETIDETAYEATPNFVAVIGFMSPRHDFGTVKQGEVLEHEFEFLNNGTADLIIEEARSDTEGVAVGVTSMPVKAGTTNKVYVTVKTLDMEGEQFIRIRLNSNAHNGNSTLYLTLNVDAES